MAINVGNLVVKSDTTPAPTPAPAQEMKKGQGSLTQLNVGNLVVKNKSKPAPVQEVKKEQGLLARFYKESRYMKDMINN